MHISDAVSSLNYNRYQCFINNETGDVESAIAASSSKSAPAVTASASASPFKPTALVFDGPAYRSFDASSFNAQQYEFAQKHVRILSGLYGVLKPWDLIQEYRLEVLPVTHSLFCDFYQHDLLILQMSFEYFCSLFPCKYDISCERLSSSESYRLCHRSIYLTRFDFSFS